ncbi:hypothetical protein M3Y95_00859300 [Aphelenchoides besseyi]|nr:hypothetical protein M3Y95_00859300 [Aphelenchoides besseyi]
MVMDGRFISRSLVCFVAFGLGLFASDPKCFEESGDKTVLKGDCKGSEVLVVKSRELKMYLKSTSVPKNEQNLNFNIGGYTIGGGYDSASRKAVILFAGNTFDLPVNIAITPEKYVVTNEISAGEYAGSFKFEKNGETYTIKVDYDPPQPQVLGSLTITFDATIFDDEEDNVAKIILAVIAALVVLAVIIIVLVVIYCLRKEQEVEEANSTSAIDTSNLVFINAPKQQQPQAYVSRVQPIVEQIKAVEKKEELMVKEHKQDEEKDKRGFQKLRVRSPQTMTIDSPAPSKQQATVAPKKSFVKEPCHETVSKTIHITLPTNDKEEPVKKHTTTGQQDTCLAPKKLREHDPDTIAIEVPSKDKEEPVKNTPQPDSKKHVLLLPLALAPKKLREHDPDTIAVELPSCAKENRPSNPPPAVKQQAFVAPDKPRGKRRRDHAPDTIAIEVPSTDKGTSMRPKKDNIEPTVTMEFKVPSATTTESLDEQQN